MKLSVGFKDLSIKILIVLITHANVRRSQLITLRYLVRSHVLQMHASSLIRFIHEGRLSVTEDYRGEQSQFTAKGHSWAV